MSTPTTSSSPIPQISAASKYLFDLNGYIVVKNVLTPEEVLRANRLVDGNMHKARERIEEGLRNAGKDTPLAGTGEGRIDLGGILEWKDDDNDDDNDNDNHDDGEKPTPTTPHPTVFHSILDHPKLLPYYHTLLGPGFRMDHMPFIIAQNKNSEGFSLHGGTIDCNTGDYNHEIAYECKHGPNGAVMRNNLLAASVVLSDHPENSGGFVVVRGSHKSNVQPPPTMINGRSDTEFVVQPVTSAGDVVLFSEGTVHGARVWNMDYQRRVALYRFSPATCSYGRSYFEDTDMEMGKGWPENMYENMTETQKAVLLPPYARRLDRPSQVIHVKEDGERGRGLLVESRSDVKKAFDKEVFGTKYF
jgi:hypothetical protein